MKRTAKSVVIHQFNDADISNEIAFDLLHIVILSIFHNDISRYTIFEGLVCSLMIHECNDYSRIHVETIIVSCKKLVCSSNLLKLSKCII